MTPTFDEVYPTIPGNGWLTEEEALLLWSVAVTAKADCLEVGCYHGRSTCLIAKAIEPHTLHTVDPFVGFDTADPTGDQTKRAFIRNVFDRKIHNVFLYVQKIEQWKPVRCEVCYLDGDHTVEGTLAQIDAALQCCPEHVLIHDVNDSGEGLLIKEAAVKRLGGYKQRAGRLARWELTR